MVEESQNTNKSKVKIAGNNRPKSVYSWSVQDVQKWFRRHCTDYYTLYGDLFVEHEITGRTLIRMNDNSLVRIGITEPAHHEAIWKQILYLKLRMDIMEIRDMQRRTTTTNNFYYQNAA